MTKAQAVIVNGILEQRDAAQAEVERLRAGLREIGSWPRVGDHETDARDTLPAVQRLARALLGDSLSPEKEPEDDQIHEAEAYEWWRGQQL